MSFLPLSNQNIHHQQFVRTPDTAMFVYSGLQTQCSLLKVLLDLKQPNLQCYNSWISCQTLVLAVNSPCKQCGVACLCSRWIKKNEVQWVTIVSLTRISKWLALCPLLPMLMALAGAGGRVCTSVRLCVCLFFHMISQTDAARITKPDI